MARRRGLVIAGKRVRPGETRDIRLAISETYAGGPVHLPIRVIRAREPGPVLFVTAAVHGDEINGTGIIRELIFDQPPELLRGALVCMPVVDVFGFENQSRYMPDRRDLNRCFPGSARGSLASRYAHSIMREIISHCDFGVDLHSAALTRTNFPNVRGDLNDRDVRDLARAFGSELIVHGKGPGGSMRRAACRAGVPTILFEAGEPHKIEPFILDIGLRGIRNVLIHLEMMAGRPTRPAYQTRVRKSTWVRAELGGLLRFHVAPGDVILGGQPVATSESVFGQARSTIIAPQGGVILGMATHPAVKPGEPICHIAIPDKPVEEIAALLKKASDGSWESRVRGHLARSFSVSEHEGHGQQ